MPSPGSWEVIVLLGVLVLVFGARKLPDMARSVGRSARVFTGKTKGLEDDGHDAEPAPTAVLPVVTAETAPLPIVARPAAVDAGRRVGGPADVTRPDQRAAPAADHARSGRRCGGSRPAGPQVGGVSWADGRAAAR